MVFFFQRFELKVGGHFIILNASGYFHDIDRVPHTVVVHNIIKYKVNNNHRIIWSGKNNVNHIILSYRKFEIKYYNLL